MGLDLLSTTSWLESFKQKDQVWNYGDDRNGFEVITQLGNAPFGCPTSSADFRLQLRESTRNLTHVTNEFDVYGTSK